MIQGIFYARFFAQEGTKIVAQAPAGCIVPEGAGGPPRKKACLFDFDVLQEYIIPRKAFFNRLVSVNDPDNKFSMLGFPVAIAHRKYQRNEFIFNFGLVVDSHFDQIPYERVVRRLAVTFAEMEKQDEYLSRDQAGPGREGRRPIESLLEIIKEDLNNYGECLIPVDDANTINMKLFPYHRTPPEVKGWHVPVAKMKFCDIVDPTWDLTMQKVVAHIDGVSDVRRVAYHADVSIELAKIALQQLLYYDAILLLDMFFFGARYAPRPGIHSFITNVCASHDYYPAAPGPSSNTGRVATDSLRRGGLPSSSIYGAWSSAGGDGGSGGGIVDECANYVCIMASGQRVSNYQLIRLMTTFSVGRTVGEWLRLHMDAGFDVLRYVDVRRLVQFGVIKGLLYRVHKYVISKQYLAALATGQSRPLAGTGKDGKAVGDPLQRYMDGCHNFDQIITEQNLTDGEIMERLKSFPGPTGDLTVHFR